MIYRYFKIFMIAAAAAVAFSCTPEEVPEDDPVIVDPEPEPEEDTTVWDELDAAYREGVDSV